LTNPIQESKEKDRLNLVGSWQIENDFP